MHFASLFSSGLWSVHHLPSLALLLVLGLLGKPAFEADWGFAALVALAGVIVGELRARTGSIWPGTALHALMNSLLVVSLARALL
jgi:membrane protease YdiL (CAAX protease family)